MKIIKNKRVLVIALSVFLGVLLVLFGSINKNGEKSAATDEKYPTKELESYTEKLEKKISTHLSKINGVGDVSVLVTIESTNEKVYATEGANKDYVIISGDNGENGILLAEINAKIRGIAVVCDYGGNEQLRQEIILALSTLFNIGTNRVSVLSA